jgi:hypothetical protein
VASLFIKTNAQAQIAKLIYPVKREFILSKSATRKVLE